MSSEFIKLLGGSALLIYAMDRLSQSVEAIAGVRFRKWMHNYSAGRLAGMVVGTFLSILLASSGVVTVLLVGFADARLLTLTQVFALSLGAGIGSTIIVHLFTFPILQYSLVFFAAGVAMKLVKKSTTRVVADPLIYLGLILFALQILGEVGGALENHELFRAALQYVKERPFVSLLFAATFAAVVRSSASTIAFAMTLVAGHHGGLLEAMPWVLGANLGTTTTGFFASLSTGALGRQAALGNLLTKIFGVIVAFPLMAEFAQLVGLIISGTPQQIAAAHTLFNAFLAILFFPFIPLGVRLVKKISPDDGTDGPFNLQFLTNHPPHTPEITLARAHREILRLSDIVEQMVERGIPLFQAKNWQEFDSVKRMDKLVDYLNRNIKLHLTNKLAKVQMTREQTQSEFELLLRTNDLENIGDIIDKNILDLVRKTTTKGYVFSAEGWREIVFYHEKVLELLRMSAAYFNYRDPSLREKLVATHSLVDGLYLELSELHVERLHQGIKESMETTSVHLDVLGYLQRISDLSVNFVRVHSLGIRKVV